MSVVPWEQPRGAVHDLEYLATLSSDRCHILCCSERSLYLLANYAALDCAFAARYAVEKSEIGYVSVSEEDPEWELFRSVVLGFQLEVLDMSCDIQTGLEAIADAIRVSGGGGCAGGSNAVLNCISDLTNEQLLGPGESSQGDKYVDPPPEGFSTWEEYFTYKCQAAQFIWDLERRYMVAVQSFDLVFLTANIAAPIIAGVAGILPASLTPVGFAVLVASLVAIGVISLGSWVFVGDMLDYWDANEDEIVCALYSSGNSVEAVGALANFIEDAIQAIVFGGELAGVGSEIASLLGVGFANLAGNGIVEPLFKNVAVVSNFSADCSSCEEGEADLFQTGLASPYNRLLVGEDIDFSGESSAGYRSQNNGTPVTLEFLMTADIDDWLFTYEVSAPDHPGETMHAVTHLQQWITDHWTTIKSWDVEEFDSDDWTEFVFTDEGTSLDDEGLYRLYLEPQELNYYAWYRRIDGRTS